MSANNAGQWTEARVKRLLDLRAAGESAGAIAKALGGGVTRSAVIGKLDRLKAAAPGARKPSVPRPRAVAPAKPEGAGRAAVVFGFLPRASVRPASEIAAERAARREEMDAITAGFAAADGEAVPLVDRGYGRCAWPVGEPTRPAEQLCCGRRVDGETSWCATHRVRVLVPLTQKTRDYVRNLRRYL